MQKKKEGITEKLSLDFFEAGVDYVTSTLG